MYDGGFCTAPVWCNEFSGEGNASYNYTDYDFKIVFNGNTTNFIKIPLFALMRNSATSTHP